MTTANTDKPMGGTPISVFLSYSREDREKALPVIKALEAHGFSVWWDGLLEGGNAFAQTTETALETADAVVVLWSVRSVQSHWVRDEATRGRDRGRMVPVSIDRTEPPLGFRQIQYISLAKWRGKARAPEIVELAKAVRNAATFHNPQLGYGTSTPAPQKPSRRGVLIGGGVAVAAVGGGLLTWQADLFDEGASASSLAVLPFANLSRDPAQSYFSEGLASEIRTALSRSASIQISGQASSNSFRGKAIDAKAIANALKVSFLLEGNVQKAGDFVKITTNLTEGKTGLSKWAETYQRPLADVFAVQSEIAAAVASALAVVIDTSIRNQESGGTKNVKALDAYMRGRALVEKNAGEETDRAALAQFDLAITADTDYAAAHALRATMLAAIANLTGKADEVRQLYDASILAARRSITLAPKLAIGYDALGSAFYYGQLNAKAARAPFARARELAPGDADILRNYANFSAYGGSPSEAAPAITRAIALDPLNARVFRSAGNIAYAAHDYPATIKWMQKALSLNREISIAHSAIGNAQLMLGQTNEAIVSYQAEPVSLFGLTGLAIAHHKLGGKADAKAVLDQMVNEFGANSLYQQAQVLIQWADKDGALEMLDRAVAMRDSGLLLARTDPMLDSLRNEPRFKTLLSALDGGKF